jgi:hypothetical protein
MQGVLDAAAKAAESAQLAAQQATAQAAAAARGTMGAAGAVSGSPATKSGKMDYFASSKLFAGSENESEFDVEAPGLGSGDASASSGSAWGSLFGGEASASAAVAEGEEAAEGGMLGSTRNLLHGSMKSMGIGKKSDDSAMSVGRAARMKYFVMLAFAAGFCFMISFTFLPIVIIRPQCGPPPLLTAVSYPFFVAVVNAPGALSRRAPRRKFALMFSLGSICACCSIPQPFFSISR